MTRRPQASLDDLTVPKDALDLPPAPAPQGALAPAAPPPAYGAKMKVYAHTLSLRLSSDQYGRLRGHVIAHENETGERLSHQHIIESALGEWLKRHARRA